jgi:crossover junction endodeoxyribonuclease RuvC
MSIVLGIDPGLANMGYAVVQIHQTTEKVIKLGAISTEKSDKKLKVLSSDDNLRRAREMYKVLAAIVVEYEPAAICVEAKSFPRNASAAAKTSISWGLIAALSESRNLPVCQCSPQQIKKAMTGKVKSEKEEVQLALNNRYGQQLLAEAGITGLKKDKIEHPYDALAAIVTCLDSDILRLLRNK